MKSKKMVSVILPTYNGEKYIRESIESVLRQTYENYELIIIDDCSTDGTPSILREYEEKYDKIRVYRNEQNQKLPKSLNIGFSHAQGDYYTWTSDDNLYHENAFEKMVSMLATYQNVGMVYADLNYIDDLGRITEAVHLPDIQNIAFGNMIGACFMYRKSVAEQVGDYDCSLYLAEDYDYWIRIMQHNRIYHLQEILYDYRRHSKSLTDRKRKKVLIQTYKTFIKHYNYLYSIPENAFDKGCFLDYFMRCAPNKKEAYQYLMRQTMLAGVYIRWKYFIEALYKRKIGKILSKLIHLFD